MLNAIFAALVALAPDLFASATINDKGFINLADDSGRGIDLLYRKESFKKPRIVIAGAWPQRDHRWVYPNQLRPAADSPTITIDAGKSPEVIAKDIMRRFWPNYVEIYQRCLDKIAEDNDYATQLRDTIKTVYAACGEPITDRVEMREGGHMFYKFPGNIGLREVSISPGRIQFRTDGCTIEKFLKIVAILKGA